MSEKEKKDLEMTFDEMDSVSGGLVVNRTPFASGIGVFDVVDDQTGRMIESLDDQDDAQAAARSIGQSDEVISNSEWAKRFNK